jgi:hypothetical protein
MFQMNIEFGSALIRHCVYDWTEPNALVVFNGIVTARPVASIGDESAITRSRLRLTERSAPYSSGGVSNKLNHLSGG